MVFDLKEYRQRMDGAVNSLRNEFAGLRTGRANAALLDGIMVEAYGQMTPLNQVGSVSVPESRMLLVSVWDKQPLTEERRKDLAKIASGYAETAKIAVRNVRRDGMETVKKAEKAGEMGEDEQKAHDRCTLL